MNKMYKKVNIVKVNQDVQHTDDVVAIDTKMKLFVNGSKLGEFYLSPRDLEDFVLGYLLDERYIETREDVKNISVNDLNIEVELITDQPVERDNLACYDGWVHQDQELVKVNSDFKVERSQVMDSFDLLIQKAEVWSKTGGTHVAALVGEGKFIVREDVSRHVAVDKVIGAGLMAEIDFSQSFIVCSGRIPPDRVVKLANVGIPIMVTKAAPTIEGLKIGENAGITLIGFLRNGRFNIYTHPHRIIL
ncbi:formate dehydrogenase accessory sulfurtransferase FdhD [Methanobacterium formicicum]|uniref:Sulfur carrier protein FdhD n=1 Tax=Methanobacterium formicicum TaxID=2162 RepID=A0A090JWB1_METFO|nr:formate dehydrogenase accessory sulfurtransferase FdhD [Methanobacterium formicicum]MDH2660582.1 formate dehydrogenase accessory sulfurtransferase FdhD [Methanobacterium formicicum]CEA13816.1 Protein fdhD [Methanobacterium formicicum]